MNIHLWDLGSNLFYFLSRIWAEHSQPNTLKLLIFGFLRFHFSYLLLLPISMMCLSYMTRFISRIISVLTRTFSIIKTFLRIIIMCHKSFIRWDLSWNNQPNPLKKSSKVCFMVLWENSRALFLVWMNMSKKMAISVLQEW